MTTAERLDGVILQAWDIMTKRVAFGHRKEGRGLKGGDGSFRFGLMKTKGDSQ